jgi:hypothetical protein
MGRFHFGQVFAMVAGNWVNSEFVSQDFLRKGFFSRFEYEMKYTDVGRV